jgi:hypothetical protein
MAVPTPGCTEKFTSVKLAAGEQFVLPPDAVLVSATDPLLIEDDGCLDRSQLEELKCYTCIVGVGAEEGDDSQLWEAEPIDGNPGGGAPTFRGFYQKTNATSSGILIPFVNDYRFFDKTGVVKNGTITGSTALTQFGNEISSLLGNQGVLNVVVTQTFNTFNRLFCYITVVAIPSVIETLSIQFTTSAVSPDMKAHFRFYETLSPYVQAFPAAPTCSLT